MSKLTDVIQSEINRLARKEIRKGLSPLARQVRDLRSAVGTLKREMADLERQLGRRLSALAAREEAASEEMGEEATPTRLSPILLKKLRRRLAISQTELAELVGVSQPAVASWEQGRAKPRAAVRDKIIGLRQHSAAQIREILGRPPDGRRRRRRQAK